MKVLNILLLFASLSAVVALSSNDAILANRQVESLLSLIVRQIGNIFQCFLDVATTGASTTLDAIRDIIIRFVLQVNNLITCANITDLRPLIACVMANLTPSNLIPLILNQPFTILAFITSTLNYTCKMKVSIALLCVLIFEVATAPSSETRAASGVTVTTSSFVGCLYNYVESEVGNATTSIIAMGPASVEYLETALNCTISTSSISVLLSDLRNCLNTSVSNAVSIPFNILNVLLTFLGQYC
ncbi:hypothetical protein FQR65_LT02047 [Abscondita terminalis]|nr:hypothetical protein FQR65_LT02047 [Abscondita terminalis]